MDYDLNNFSPNVRRLNEMAKVIFDKEWFEKSEDLELYYMYRGLEEKDEIRYDITVVPPLMMGKEFVKTKGHYHKGKYQEIYSVLEGKAIYLMQKPKSKEDYSDIEDVFAVECQKGDFIIIPPDYGHITINPSEKEELKMANWIFSGCKSDYSPFEELSGACYYYIKDNSQNQGASLAGRRVWVKNNNYKNVPDLHFKKPEKSLPENLDFLK